MIMKMIH